MPDSLPLTASKATAGTLSPFPPSAKHPSCRSLGLGADSKLLCCSCRIFVSNPPWEDGLGCRLRHQEAHAASAATLWPLKSLSPPSHSFMHASVHSFHRTLSVYHVPGTSESGTPQPCLLAATGGLWREVGWELLSGSLAGKASLPPNGTSFPDQERLPLKPEVGVTPFTLWWSSHWAECVH